VPVLIGSAAFRRTARQGVGLRVRLTERKPGRAEARESEHDTEVQCTGARQPRRHHGSSLGLDTHEVNPITAAVTYVRTPLALASRGPPNFREVDDALSLICQGGDRAGESSGRSRALIKKAPARKDAVAINESSSR